MGETGMSIIWIDSGRFAPPVDTDPYRSLVVLHLTGSGADGSTNIIDSGPSSRSITAVGNARISTARGKFYGSSILLDGTGDRLTVNTTTGFAAGLGEITVEGWFYVSARTSFPSIIEIGNHQQTTGLMALDRDVGLSFYSGGFYESGVIPSLNTFNHLAWVRKSILVNSVPTLMSKCFVNGVGGAAVALPNNWTASSPVTIGSRSGGSGAYDLNANINDLRVTMYGRYWDNFTPPSGPLPTS